MKKQDYKKLALMMMAAGTMMAAGPALAKDHGDHGGPGGKGPRGEAMFKQADTNNDGFLTKEEMLKSHETRIDKMFTDMDADKDGKLSKAELEAGREKMKEKWKEKMKDKKEKGDGYKVAPPDTAQ